MIYLDNAATTYPKPPCLAEAMTRAMQEAGGNPGRSGHPLSMRAAEEVYSCRSAIAKLFGSLHPENVVFTLNTSYALNLAIKSLISPGSHVLISDMEHNSVYRPIYALSKKGEIEFDTFHVLQSTNRILEELQSRIRKNTRMLVMMHASNICGAAFPIREIGAFCHRHGITFIVDAAQSAGVLPIHLQKDNIDALCAPAHKGLYGPTGLGFVLYGENVRPHAVFEGGNGIRSSEPDMGDDLPESLEAGTLPVAAIAGLRASLTWLSEIGIGKIHAEEIAGIRYIQKEFMHCKRLQLFQPTYPQTGILLFRHESMTVEALGQALAEKEICVRGGFHCSPLAHTTLHTGKEGALRISTGYFNTQPELEKFCDCVFSICKS